MSLALIIKEKQNVKLSRIIKLRFPFKFQSLSLLERPTTLTLTSHGATNQNRATVHFQVARFFRRILTASLCSRVSTQEVGEDEEERTD